MQSSSELVAALALAGTAIGVLSSVAAAATTTCSEGGRNSIDNKRALGQ